MYQPRLAYLFNKYINKKCTPDEKMELFRLLDNPNADAALKQLLDELVANTDAEIKLSEESGNNILQAILGEQRREVPYQPIRKLSTNRYRLWWSVSAASVLLMFSIAYWFFSYQQQDQRDTIAAKTDSHTRQFLSAGTTTGQWKNILLADGTRVWLSPASSIQYPAVFTGNTREINLSGEAFFEVAHDPAHPFIIRSGDIETRVLGTSFNIRAYDNQDDISVTVVTGKVNVTDKAKAEHVELVANQRAVFHRNTTKLEKENAGDNQAPDLLRRKDGMFVYTYEPLQKVIDDLREYFGVEIKVAPEIKECKVMANFYANQEIQEILEPIALAINGSVQTINDEFILTGKGCPK